MERVIFKIKFCSEEKYLEDFLNGELYMNTLGHFRRYEDRLTGNVGDRHEGAVVVMQPGQHTITIKEHTGRIGEFSIPGEDMAGPTYVQHSEHDLMNVFCMYAVHHKGPIGASDVDFERFVDAQMLQAEVGGLGGFAAIVLEAKVFQERVCHALRQTGAKAMAGLVTYYDQTTFHGKFDEQQAAFQKGNTFAHQREYRFALDRAVAKEEKFTLSVGSLRDLCTACRTDEVNDNLRDLLHQLRSQGGL